MQKVTAQCSLCGSMSSLAALTTCYRGSVEQRSSIELQSVGVFTQHGHFHLRGHHALSQSKYSLGVFVCSPPQVGPPCQLHGGPQHSQPPQQDLLGQPSALGQDRSPWVQPMHVYRDAALKKRLRRVILWCNAAKCEKSDAVVWVLGAEMHRLVHLPTSAQLVSSRMWRKWF